MQPPHAPPPTRTSPTLRTPIERLRDCGIQPTAQRRQIAAVLLATDQHVCADQLLAMLRQRGALVSKATLYNTLRLFARHGLVRELMVDGARVWFDSNVTPHYHFQDERNGGLSDIAVGEVEFGRLPTPPEGMEIAAIDLVIRLRPRR